MIAHCLIFLATLQFSAVAEETNTVLSTNIVASTNAQATNGTNIAAKPAGNPRKDFEAFRIIAQRNIFNPNRTARDGDSRRPERDRSRPSRSDSFTLVGTMLYESGQFAFFDGSSSTYKKVVKAGDAFAGYTVKEVTPNGVNLEGKGKTVSLTVGQKMRKQDEGDWGVSGAGTADMDSNSSTSETTSASGESDSSSSTSSGGSSNDDDEVIKRLMKKREEEMKK